MLGLLHRQDSVLCGVDGGDDVLLDDSGEGVAHELDGVVPVAPAGLLQIESAQTMSLSVPY